MNPPKRSIVVPVTEEQFRTFKIEAITKGLTTPKLAIQRLFPDAQPVATVITPRKEPS